MGSSEIADQNYPAEIIGYVEPWICSPGETVDVKVRLLMITQELPPSLSS
jgi:hypothetical protein